MTDEEKAKLAVIEEKVDGINSRLDTMNGTAAKTKGRLREVEDYILVNKSKNKITAWIVNNLTGIISTIVSATTVAFLIWHFGIGGG